MQGDMQSLSQTHKTGGVADEQKQQKHNSTA